jgi:hypothetical protein
LGAALQVRQAEKRVLLEAERRMDAERRQRSAALDEVRPISYLTPLSLSLFYPILAVGSALDEVQPSMYDPALPYGLFYPTLPVLPST